MADFVAVLRKAISNLGENTPEMREKVYDKARATIEAKLAAINPPPPASVADRQRNCVAYDGDNHHGRRGVAIVSRVTHVRRDTWAEAALA